jgi:NADPH:quinone reductase-like Zn-dependent oxidoreductase
MVGGFALQLAMARGARVVAAVRDSDADEARRLGAETVVSTESDLEANVRGHREDGVDVCIDTVGLGETALSCVRDDGRFVTSVPTAIPDATRGIDPGTVQVQPDAAATAELAGRAAAGKLTVRVAETLPLERFRDAYARLGSGGLRGKIVLTP